MKKELALKMKPRPFSPARQSFFWLGLFPLAGVSLIAWWGWDLGQASPPPVYEVTPSTITATALPPPFRVMHQPTPESVRALYVTSWVASTPSRFAQLLELAEKTEINSVVIDIKDYTGKISFLVEDPVLQLHGAAENRIKDIKQFIGDLHDRGLYVIGRISVFQDTHLVEQLPELAVRRASDGGVWRDRKGIAWLDPAARPVWDYVVSLAKESYAIGFDELNFDYIRFPSDGNMKDIAYTHFIERPTPSDGRAEAMGDFFAYLSGELASLGVPLSVDLFGLTTVNPDDLGIGQVLETALPHFDYIAPMVYPSHYADGFIGYENPAAHPYEVVKYSLDRAQARINQFGLATSTAHLARGRLRPWLQDFDLGADYTAELVRAQIKATYDAGVDSWMLWDPSNRYTADALLTPP